MELNSRSNEFETNQRVLIASPLKTMSCWYPITLAETPTISRHNHHRCSVPAPYQNRTLANKEQSAIETEKHRRGRKEQGNEKIIRDTIVPKFFLFCIAEEAHVYLHSIPINCLLRWMTVYDNNISMRIYFTVSCISKHSEQQSVLNNAISRTIVQRKLRLDDRNLFYIIGSPLFNK